MAVQVPSEDEAVSETTRLAENPELMAAERYAATRADLEVILLLSQFISQPGSSPDRRVMNNNDLAP